MGHCTHWLPALGDVDLSFDATSFDFFISISDSCLACQKLTGLFLIFKSDL